MTMQKGQLPAHVKPLTFEHPQKDHVIVALMRGIEDPRRPSIGFKYSLVSVLFMVLVGIICGAKDWEQVVTINQTLKDWLKQYVDMRAGVPCESTFMNIFNALNPQRVESLLRDVARVLCVNIERTTVAFDGQALRGSASPSEGKSSLHLLHAWSVEHGICLGQLAVDEKSNEITAFPKLVELLDLKKAIVTADALNTQTENVKAVAEAKADYVFPLKGNHSGFLSEIEDSFKSLTEEKAAKKSLWERAVIKARSHKDNDRLERLLESGPKLPGLVFVDSGKDHGRVEERTYTCWSAKDLPSLNRWTHLKSLIRVDRTRSVNGKTSSETVYYITSLSLQEMEHATAAIRNHWGVENKLHWVMDVVFRQDDSRYRDRTGAANLAILRKIALTVLSREQSSLKKRSIACKQLRALADPSYRTLLLNSLIKFFS